MKLYKLSQDLNNNYDTYDSCVVCAENEDEARMIHPSEFVTHYDDENWYGTYSGGDQKGKEYVTEDSFPTWVLRSQVNLIKVEYLGEADKKLKKGVVCASFNAG